MKRSLIVLLVVAMLAMMVPTIASAAPTLTKFELNTDHLRGYVSRTIDGDKGQVVLQTEGTVNIISQVSEGDSSAIEVVWTTSDRNIVGFKANPDHNTVSQTLDADGNTTIVELNGRGVGTVTLTGKAYLATDLRHQTVLGTVSLTVEAKLVPEKEVRINTDGLDDAHKVAGKKNTFEYYIGGGLEGDPASISEIMGGKVDFEARTIVLPDGKTEKKSENDWASTYGVSELIWSSSNEAIASVDNHGVVTFKNGKITDDPTTLVITATAKGDSSVKGTVTIILHPKKSETSPSDESYKSIQFTQKGLNVERGLNDALNLSDYLELYPRPAGWYKKSEHTDDEDSGNYGVLDEIRWTSSDESIAWICQDEWVYEEYGHNDGRNPKNIPGWGDCFVVVNWDAEDGDQVTITATSVNNPSVSASIVLTVKASDKKSLRFERNAYSLKVGDDATLEVLPFEDWMGVSSRYTHVTSSNPEVVSASISWYGVDVYAKAPGQATITLESDRYLKAPISTVVTVKGDAIKSVTVPAKYQNITMPLYDVEAVAEVTDGMNTTDVYVNVNPSDAYYEATWTSSDPTVAYVVYDGNVNNTSRYATIRAAGVGECTINVSVTDGTNTFTASMNVKVVKAKATQLALNKTKGTFYLIKGGDNTLQLIATDKKTGDEVPVTWKTSDKKIGTVNKNGVVTLKKEGTVKITATTKDGYVAEKTCTITVKKLAVKKISVTKKKTMKVGDTAFVSYKVSPAKAYNPALTFKSSNKKVVTVDKYGALEALKPGKAEITITAKDGSGVTATVTITVKDVANNADDEVIVEDDSLELTLDGIDGIEDLSIDDGVVLNSNEVIELTLD